MAGRPKRARQRLLESGIVVEEPEAQPKAGRGSCPGCGRPADAPHPECLKKRAEALYDQEIRRQLREYAVPIDITPEVALLSLVREAAGNVAWLGARVQQLVDDSPIRGDTEGGVVPLGTPSRTTGSGRQGGYDQGDLLFGPRIELDRNGAEHIVGEDYRAMLTLYNEERDRLKAYAKDAISAGILKSQVDLAQYQAQQMVLMLNRVLDKMGVTDEIHAMARRLMSEEFRIQAEVPIT